MVYDLPRKITFTAYHATPYDPSELLLISQTPTIYLCLVCNEIMDSWTLRPPDLPLSSISWKIFRQPLHRMWDIMALGIWRLQSRPPQKPSDKISDRLIWSLGNKKTAWHTFTSITTTANRVKYGESQQTTTNGQVVNVPYNNMVVVVVHMSTE